MARVMPWFEIECETEGREVYQIEAADENRAREILYNDTPKPVVMETLWFTVKHVKEVSEDE